MSLNKITLYPQLLVQLYADALVETGSLPPPAQPELQAQIPVPFLGRNRRHILILVAYPDAVHLPDADLEFLSSVLAACKLSMADVALLNWQRCPQPYTQLLSAVESRQVLLFGITPEQLDLPLNFPPFQLQPFAQCTYLAAPALGQLKNDQGLKGRLWSCLKNLFDI